MQIVHNILNGSNAIIGRNSWVETKMLVAA